MIGADPRLLPAAQDQGVVGRRDSISIRARSPSTSDASADPAAIHGSCEDYRAAASIDLEHDDEDVAAGRKVACPLLVLWGERGVVHRLFRPLEDWAAGRGDVRGRALPCGHYLAEEAPEETLAELRVLGEALRRG